MRQTEQRFEVIVVDDCSVDETAAIVTDIARSDPRIKLISLPKNVGPGAARNVAIDAAVGTWVALLDSDDRYHPCRLERLLQMATRTDADMVSDNIILCPEGKAEPESIMYSRERIPCEMQLTATEFIIQNTKTGNGKRSGFVFMQPMLRRKFLLESGARYDPGNRCGEDFMFYVQCLVRDASWWITPEPLYFYNIRHGSLTDRVTPGDLRAISALEQELLGRALTSSNAEFAAALRKHKRTVDHWRYTMAFKAALKRRDFAVAFDTAFESRSSFQSILRDAAANAFLKVYRPYSRSG